MAMLLNGARLKENLELVDYLPNPEGPPSSSTQGPLLPAAASSIPTFPTSMVKVKLSQVIDQASDQEVPTLDAVKVNDYRQRLQAQVFGHLW